MFVGCLFLLIHGPTLLRCVSACRWLPGAVRFKGLSLPFSIKLKKERLLILTWEHTGTRNTMGRRQCEHPGGCDKSAQGATKRCKRHNKCPHDAARHLCNDQTCIRERASCRLLAADILSAEPVGVAAISAGPVVQLPIATPLPQAHPATPLVQTYPQTPRGKKRVRSTDDGRYADVDGMQLTLALATPVQENGLPAEHRQEHPSSSAQVGQASSSSADAVEATSEEAGAESDSEDDGDETQCFGMCLAFGESIVTFAGSPRSRPDREEPEGGWGYTACCSKPLHFECLGRWLNGLGRETMESSRGMVACSESGK